MFPWCPDWLEAVVAGLVLVQGYKWLLAFLPGFVVGKVDLAINLMRDSAYFRNPAHPHRWEFLKAFFIFLEKELPDKGTGGLFYKRIGDWIAGLHLLLAGSSARWAGALEVSGDAIDTRLDNVIVEMKDAPPALPPPPPPVP